MKKRALQCFFCICIIGFAFLCGTKQKREVAEVTKLLMKPDEEQAFENVLCSCVRIQGNGHYGSGNIYRIEEGQMVIITNQHVLQYYDRDGYVIFFDGKKVAGEVLFVSEDYDLGFLSVKTEAFLQEELSAYRSVRCVPAMYDSLQKNDCFFMIDIATDIENPQKHSGEVVNSRKYLEDYGQEMFYGDAYAKEGMSGCGIFDAYGQYLALLSGGTVYNEIAAVPLDVIENEYQKIKK